MLLLTVFKRTGPWALMALAAAGSQTARGQATLTDVSPAASPPRPGPNDICQTNTLDENSQSGTFNYYTDATGRPGGTTFVTGSNPNGYLVTNAFVQCLATGYGNDGSGSGSPTATQAYQISFFQVSGTTDASGLGSNATLISQIITSPGTVTTVGDWLSFSNFLVLLSPNTTNAFTWGRLSSGSGYMGIPLVTNNIGNGPATWPGPFAGGQPCLITPGGGIGAVTYGVGTTLGGTPLTNFDTVFSLGIMTNFIPAAITATNAFPSEELLAGLTATITSSGTGTPPCSGYWQKNSGSSWTNLNNGGNISGARTVALGATQAGTLVISNLGASDAGSYRLVLTNSENGVTLNSATGGVVALAVTAAPPANSFAAVALTPGYGAVAFWPLNETNDPSTGTAQAYDIIGGFNGYYGTNADNGGGNAVDAFAPAAGPQPPGCTGFPAGNGALGSVQGSLTNSFVTTRATPAFPAGNTNVTLVGWIYPSLGAENSATGLAVMRAGTAGATRTDGLAYGTSDQLSYIWDNNSSATWGFGSGLIIPSGVWSMLALVITPSNSVLYVGSKGGLSSATQTIVNSNEPWGGGWVMGGDPGVSATGRSFAGQMSSLVMFSNSLSATQIGTLYAGGLAQGNVPPVITGPPSSTTVYVRQSAQFAVAAYGIGALSYQWQENTGTVWENVQNGNGISGANSNTLVISNAAAGNAASYQVIVSDFLGSATNPAPATLNVTLAPLTVTAANAMRAYGQTNPVFTGTMTGLINGDNITADYTCGATATSPVGTYAIVPSLVDPNDLETNYAVSLIAGVLTVTLTPEVITWTNPAPIAYGTALTGGQLNATANVPGSFAYTPDNGAVLPAGSNTLTVVFTPSNTVDYAVVTDSVSLLVLPGESLATGANRDLLDAGWRFELGDPADVTTNVTYYPEIGDLAKLQTSAVGSGTGTETYMESIRVDIFATHAGENVSFVQTNYDDSSWRQVNLPHDWADELPFNSSADGGHGFKPVGNGSFTTNNIGWYRHTFTLPASYAGQALWLEFDGVYRNCLVWLNGHILGRNVSGYESFYFDVTPYANPGGSNVLVVRVDASRFEGWFYEGAGIYRHVWLKAVNPVHVAEWGTYVATTALAGSNATLTVQTEVTNQSGLATVNGSLTSTIYDANSNAVATVTSPLSVPAGQDLVVTQIVTVTANLWSLQTPYLYNLATIVSNQNAVADFGNTPFGVRTVSFDTNSGVFINGQHVEVQGMCNHQDHAGVGSALPDRLQYYRIERLKEMGVTGYRTSHNEPTAELLDACDQLGMLVLDENRRIGTNAEPLGELSRQIRRDRNHPSVFCWSLANEENAMQGSATGASILQVMQNLANQLDPSRLCTAAMNGSWGSGFSTVLAVQGFNYNLGGMDGFHSSYPNQPCIGTETASTVTTRGIYTNDTTAFYCAAYDLQNSSVGWGESAESWWPYYEARPWSSGGFCWTGFDYRGEPTPYGWPCINSDFGIMDTCGFAKDNFYYYQANWTFKPLLHLLPHWNWTTPRQPINIWAYGTCQAVELFVNGVSQGRQNLNLQGHVEWDNVPYTPGTIQAIGYSHGAAVLTNTVATTGTPAAIALWPDRSTLLADGRDVSVVTVAVLDAQGRVVPVATNLISFTLSGGGAILGVGNGNPTSHEADKASQRAVFNGLAEVIIQSTNAPGTITLSATGSGLASTNITIAEAATLPPPAPPTAVAAVGGNAQVTVSWDIVPGATTYNLWRAGNSGGPYTLMAGNIGGVNLGYADSNVTNLITYYYVVTANGHGVSTNSAEVSATPAAVVTGLTATEGSGQIYLSWVGSPGAEYNVKRSTVTGGPYTTLASAIMSPNYTDAGVVTCEAYYYVVTITNAGNESLPSAEASAVLPGGAPPAPWLSADIGAVGLAGSATYCSGQFTVTGSGADIWGTGDAFQFVYVYVPVSTNCDIRARVDSIVNTSGNAKAAVMIRETLDPGSRHALADVEPSAGIELLWRTNTGSATTASVVGGQTAPNWVRLTRTNSSFSAFYSHDGNTWTQIGATVVIPNMAVSAYAGLAVCAH
ncbi:MAG TPA: beta-galactosidase GalA, partial [Candidatus Acidoferrum sp.]|nr:beta-galactosidase GalA [Candidatus Acidoferrum sp.]